ncbi:MAG: DNA polymerase III subunit delta' [Deltaproteobacteria bacterium]|jgi:DNA polymerase-3 subunit delta'|nr:DNA polymerase III subunit delta' [Deltaproteobacteria bacterium]
MAKKTHTAPRPETDFPNADEVASVMEAGRIFAADRRFEHTLSSMGRLYSSPPQCLLLEGGLQTERKQAALYWAALLNCTQRQNHTAPFRPCMACPACVLFFSCIHRDLFFFDGAAENISIDAVRELRAILGEAPRESRLRVGVLFEAQSMLAPAANALLKSLEDPMEGNVFILTAPQRERLLPTLVSRSWTLTLPWPDSIAQWERSAAPSVVEEWAGALSRFAANGRGWMERTARKGAMDERLVHELLILCQRALVLAMQSPGPSAHATDGDALYAVISRLNHKNQRLLYEALAECQDSLIYRVNPALLADWLATRLFFMLDESLPADG